MSEAITARRLANTLTSLGSAELTIGADGRLYAGNTPVVQIPERPAITKGTGATLVIGSDRYPYTVVAVFSSGKRIEVQADKYKRTDSNGMSESQDYTFSRDEDAKVKTFTLRSSGRWVLKGQRDEGRGMHLKVGERRAYQDPSF